MNFDLNKDKPKVMHIDLNSAFATTEQQAHPSLRGRAIGVTNRLSKECCVIAASYEAKALGIKVGMRRSEAMAICPDFIMLESDAPKYHQVYQKLVAIMRDYSPKAKMKSIDEGIIEFYGMEPILKNKSLEDIGWEIKQRVKDEMGEWMRINVGIGTNRFLAKQAASWHKPDGLDIIDHGNLVEYYKQVKLTDLTGIAERNEARLNAFGIYTPMDFLEASEEALKRQVFQSITGHYWYRRLRGYEIDDYDTNLGMVGRQWVISDAVKNGDKLTSCLGHLSETVGAKLRYRNVEARGICVWVSYRNGEYYRNKRMFKSTFYTNQEVYRRALELFNQRPPGTATCIGVYCYQLEQSRESQLGLFEDTVKLGDLTKSMDEINDRYGIFTVHLASTIDGKRLIKQKIPFGGTEYFELLLKKA